MTDVDQNRGTLRVALAAARQIDRDIPYNLARMEHWMRQGKAGGAALVCFGETFLQGFDCFEWQYERDCRMAVSVDSDVFGAVCRLSAEIGIDVLFGFAELAGEAIFSSCALIENGRLRHLYRRISRGWKEYSRTDDHYREGTKVVPFSYRGRSCLVGLCGDLWDYPERFRQGQDVLFWPVYISYTPAEWGGGVRAEYAQQAARCGRKVLLCNCIAGEDAWGGAVCFENGTIAAELPMGQEGLLFVEL